MLAFPHDFPLLFRKRRRTRALGEQAGLAAVRPRCGGADDAGTRVVGRALPARRGVKPVIHQSEYNKYFEDTVLDPKTLIEFAPDLVYLHLATGSLNAPGLEEHELEAVRAGREWITSRPCGAPCGPRCRVRSS